MTEDISGKADPLERIAIALLDEIRSRKPVVSTTDITTEGPVAAPDLVMENKPTPRTPRKRERRVGQYPEHLNVRIRAADRDRFDAYAHRHRLMKGEVFRQMMDALEAQESGQEKQ